LKPGKNWVQLRL